jgi:hypothetical protein
MRAARSRACRVTAFALIALTASPVLAQPVPSAAPAAPPASAAPAASAVPTTTAPATTAAPAAGSPAAAAAAAAAAADGPTPEAKAEARVHFDKGLVLLRESAFSAALAEFLLSLDLFPRPNSTLNAAFCLRKLQRYDESLDRYEQFLRDFQNIPPNDKVNAQRAIADLRGLVGTIDIDGAEPGSLISISGASRGEFPPVAPLRVGAGSQLVRVFKEGYEPYETRVDVAGGQLVRVSAKMHALKASGRLKVAEAGGRTVDVIVDNSVMGQAPWEGVLAVGTHMVMLRGQGKLGTQPVSTQIKSGQNATLALRAEELDGALRVVPTPSGALVAIDSVDIGSGNWSGRVKSGAHKVEISAPGFVKEIRDVKVEPGGIGVVTAALERDDDAPQWQKPSKIFVDASAGLAVAPSFGGAVSEACKETCTGGSGIGAIVKIHAGYERGSGFGLGITLGYLAAFQDTTNRTADLVPAFNQDAISGQGTDRLRLSGFAAGAHLSIRYGEKIPFLARVSGGVLLANVRDERSGSFQARTTGKPITIAPVPFAIDSTYAFVNPEIRLGYHFTERFEASLGLQAFVLIATSQPRWDSKIELDAQDEGIATFKDDTLTGPFVFFLVPSLSARYNF